MPNEDNLKPPQSTEEARERGAKGGRASGVARRQKRTIAEYLQKWADLEVSEKDKKALEALGLDEEATNRTLLVIPLIKNASKGDIKSLQMIIDLLGEDKKKEVEIKKLKEEIKLLKLEQAKLRMLSGEDRDIEDLAGLADMLKIDNNDSEDDV